MDENNAWEQKKKIHEERLSGKQQGTQDGVLSALKRMLPVALMLGALLLIIAMDTPEKKAARDAEAVNQSLQAENTAAENNAASADGGSTLPLSVSGFSLDTFWTLTIYEGGGEEALSKAEKLLGHYDSLFNQSRTESDIYRINHRDTNEVEISEDMASLLETAKAFSEESGGDFDVTVGQLTELWDLKNRKTAPAEAEVAEALSACDMDGFEIVRRGGKAFFVTENSRIQIDVGAIAKGFIADRLKEGMLSDGVQSAIINLGGNVLCVGGRTEAEDFVISLRKPEKDSQDAIATLSVRDLSVVTAGIYERFFEENGVHYHHILSTKDGWPVQNELSAVSVVGANSAYCDALSTTLFIKGTEGGQAFLAEFNEAHAGENGAYYAFFIGKDGSITASEGAEAFVLSTYDGYGIRQSAGQPAGQ